MENGKFHVLNVPKKGTELFFSVSPFSYYFGIFKLNYLKIIGFIYLHFVLQAGVSIILPLE